MTHNGEHIKSSIDDKHKWEFLYFWKRVSEKHLTCMKVNRFPPHPWAKVLSSLKSKKLMTVVAVQAWMTKITISIKLGEKDAGFTTFVTYCLFFKQNVEDITRTGKIFFKKMI